MTNLDCGRVLLTQTVWSSMEGNAKPCGWGGITQFIGPAWGLTGWKESLQKNTWKSWLTKSTNTPLQEKRKKKGVGVGWVTTFWAALQIALPAGWVRWSSGWLKKILFLRLLSLILSSIIAYCICRSVFFCYLEAYYFSSVLPCQPVFLIAFIPYRSAFLLHFIIYLVYLCHNLNSSFISLKFFTYFH